MKFKLLVLMLVMLCFFLHSAPLWAQSAERGLTVDNEVIISVAANNNLPALEWIENTNTFPALSKKRLSSFATRMQTNRTSNLSRNEFGLSYYSFRNPCETSATLRRLLRTRAGLLCERNRVITADAANPLINDTHKALLYALDTSSVGRINAAEAWGLSTGSSSVVVGILDSGMNYTHPDLSANVWVNPGEIAGNGIDDDGNGYIDDVNGVDTVNNDSNPVDDNFHGTHVAGTIGAVGNNGLGVAGVAWSVKMIPCKFLNAGGSGSTSGAIQCLDYMTNLKSNAGINIVATNNSWGGGSSFSSALYQAIQRSEAANILFVAAAGNSGSDNDAVATYPANFDLSNIISVAAIDQNGGLASFSNYGATTVDIGAPGVSIASTYSGNSYAYLSGTSMATPQVTGAIALLRSYKPNLTMTQTKASITTSGTALSSLSGKTSTGKNINLFGALTTTQSTVTPTSTPTSTATATATATATSAPTIIPTATPSIAPTVSPTIAPTIEIPAPAQPTQPPIATVTATPTSTLTPPLLVAANSVVAISATRGASAFKIQCKISERSAKSRGRATLRSTARLSGFTVSVLDSRNRSRARGVTDSTGSAAFNFSTKKQERYNRCSAKMSDGRTVYSAFARVTALRK